MVVIAVVALVDVAAWRITMPECLHTGQGKLHMAVAQLTGNVPGRVYTAVKWLPGVIAIMLFVALQHCSPAPFAVWGGLVLSIPVSWSDSTGTPGWCFMIR